MDRTSKGNQTPASTPHTQRLVRRAIASCDWAIALVTFGKVRIERCIFCGERLKPGSEEHIFPAAIGGRARTRSATCVQCNNAFSKGDKVDEAVADAFEVTRCALMIWTGRDKPPPTIVRAGSMPDGTEYDLGPGLVPITRRAKVPKVTVSGEYGIVAANAADGQRVVDILGKQGHKVQMGKVEQVTQKAPTAHVRLNLKPLSLARGAAKISITAACLVYGNIRTRRKVGFDILDACMHGVPDIAEHAGMDFWNSVPSSVQLTAHKAAKASQTSGFEHTVIFADVGSEWVAYVTLFGTFPLSVRLGPASGLDVAGISVNPRAGSQSRFEVSAVAPDRFVRHAIDDFSSKGRVVQAGCEQALEKILASWQTESRQALQAERSAELEQAMSEAGEDEEARHQALMRLWSKWTTVESGDAWKE